MYAHKVVKKKEFLKDFKFFKLKVNMNLHCTYINIFQLFKMFITRVRYPNSKPLSNNIIVICITTILVFCFYGL